MDNYSLFGKKTKIVCTIGPKSESYDVMLELAKAGMNIIRLNFSHGSYEEHLKRMQNAYKISDETGINLAIMIDTKGPEIRCGEFLNDEEHYKIGDIVYVVKEEILGTKERFHIRSPELFDDVVPGNYILINDGKMKLTILENDGSELKCRIDVNGLLALIKDVIFLELVYQCHLFLKR